MSNSKEDMNLARTLVIVTLFFCGGIITGYYTNIYYLWSGILASVVVIACIFGKVKKSLRVCMLLIIFLLGMFWVDRVETDLYNLEPWQDQIVRITGEVANITPHTNQVVVKVFKINNQDYGTGGKVLIKTAWGDVANYRWGDRVEFTGKLEKTLPATNPGGFSEREYWRQKSIAYKLNASQVGEIKEKVRGFKKHTVVIRGKIYSVLQTNLPEKEAGMLIGLLLGDKKALDSDFYTTAQKLGIAHVFAVSGLHVGVALAFYLAVTGFFRLSSTPAMVGAWVLLFVYSLLAGFTPSVVRASLMGGFGLLAIKWLKYRDFYTLLALAAFLIVVADPLSIFAIGFQLSFITTWGLVYFFPLAKKILSFLPEWAAVILAVPIAAQLASFPLTLYHFNTLSLLAPLMNILIVPLVSLLVPLLFTALVLAMITIKLAQPFILLSGAIAYGVLTFVEFFTASFSSGHLYLAQPSLLFILSCYLLLIIAREVGGGTRFGSLKVVRFFAIIILGLFFILTALPKDLPLEVAFLDVGQGDGAVIKTPLNQFIVIDGGSGPSTITNYLRYKGANKVALVILSHPDADHINGLYQVFENFKVQTLLVPPDIEGSQALAELKALAVKNKTQIVEGSRGLDLKLPSGISFHVLLPEPNFKEKLDANNGSLIINCAYKEQDFLFTGDVDWEILQRILPVDREIEIIKVPHHGSRGSYIDAFYEEINPLAAIFSVGRDNRYGHPHQEVLTGLGEKNIDIYRTDRQGAVIFYTDGSAMWVKKMLK